MNFNVWKPAKGEHSPWGCIQRVEEAAPGIIRVHTASHGGFCISDERIAEYTDLVGEKPVSPFLTSENWYEEDCDSSIIYAMWGEEFHDSYARGKQIEWKIIARDMILNYRPGYFASSLIDFLKIN